MTRLMLPQRKGGSLATFKLLRLYQSEKGIWRYDIERKGKVYYASLHTRNEVHARGIYERIARTLAEWKVESGAKGAA